MFYFRQPLPHIHTLIHCFPASLFYFWTVCHPAAFPAGFMYSLGMIGSTLAKEDAMLMRSLPSKCVNGWYRGGLLEKLRLPVKGQGILLGLPYCPLAPSKLPFPSDVARFIPKPPPPNFINSFKGKFYLSSIFANGINAAHTWKQPPQLQGLRSSGRATFLCIGTLRNVYIFKTLARFCSLQAQWYCNVGVIFNKQEVLTMWWDRKTLCFSVSFCD